MLSNAENRAASITQAEYGSALRSLLRHPDAHLKSSQAWRCDGLASALAGGTDDERVECRRLGHGGHLGKALQGGLLGGGKLGGVLQ